MNDLVDALRMRYPKAYDKIKKHKIPNQTELREITSYLYGYADAKGSDIHPFVSINIMCGRIDRIFLWEIKYQYYHMNDYCKARKTGDPDCICWHDEGTGPEKTLHYTTISSPVKWRIKE